VVVVAAVKPELAWTGASMAVIGSLIGSMFLFVLARKGGEAYLSRYTARGRGAALKRWFVRYGMLTIFVPGLVPIPMPLKIFELSAGALGVRPVVFVVVLLTARIGRYFGLAWLGTQLGDQTIPYLKSHIVLLLAMSTVLFVMLYLLIRWLDRNRKLPAALTETE
jgi:membrane protein YqaA with SNARE-associated domain